MKVIFMKLSKQDITNKLNSLSTIKDKILWLIDNYPDNYSRMIKTRADLYAEINKLTPLLQDWNYTIATKCYWIINDIHNFPKCDNPKCDKIIHIHENVIRVKVGYYARHCSKKCAAQNPEVRAKYNQTIKTVYNVDYISQSQIMKDKSKATSMRLHNEPHFTNVQQRSETNIIRYNSPSPFGNADIQLKCTKTFNKKYKVNRPAQNSTIRKKAQRKYVYDEKYFDSKPELAYYLWLKDNNVQFEYQPNITFKYYVNGKLHYYHPDFIVKNKLVEIKGAHFFNKDGIMFCPYHNHNADSATIQLNNLIAKEKHMCMIKRNVKIILDTSTEMKDILEYISNKYGKNYLKLFKKK